MKMVFNMLLILLVCCVLSACVDDMNKSEFLKNIQKHSTETINNVWYIGSVDGFDYFIHNTATRTQKIKIKENQIYLTTHFILTTDKNKWLLLKSDADYLLRWNPIDALYNHSDLKINIDSKSLNHAILKDK